MKGFEGASSGDGKGCVRAQGRSGGIGEGKSWNCGGDRGWKAIVEHGLTGVPRKGDAHVVDRGNSSAESWEGAMVHQLKTEDTALAYLVSASWH